LTPFEVSVVASTAITDLINGALMLIAFFFLLRVLPRTLPERRHWLRFMLMASVSSILGWATHIYPWEFGMMFLLWLVLSAAILETAHSFFMLGCCTISGGVRPDRKQLRGLRLLELAALLFLVVAMLVRWHPIQPLVALAVLLVIPGLYFVIRLALRRHVGARILLCFVIPLIPCLVLQLMGFHEEIVFGALNVDGLCHLFLMVDIPIVYLAARKWSGISTDVEKETATE